MFWSFSVFEQDVRNGSRYDYPGVFHQSLSTLVVIQVEITNGQGIYCDNVKDDLAALQH